MKITLEQQEIDTIQEALREASDLLDHFYVLFDGITTKMEEIDAVKTKIFNASYHVLNREGPKW